jgi:gamma-glutamylcyclotransferase (GGCT)/AIG2-like uncharacterized protein YtfP
MKKNVYVYGTLRKGVANGVVLVPGTLYNLGWFPGLVLDHSEEPKSFVTCEVIQADDEKIAMLDSYEGYNPDNPEKSLYIRQPFKDGFIYTINRDVSDRPVISSGDWLDVPNATTGAYV